MQKRKNMKKLIGIAGGGAMGSGIAQIIAQCGYDVIIYDPFESVLQRAKENCWLSLQKLEEKGKFKNNEAKEVFQRMQFTNEISELHAIEIFIEAIPEELNLKQQLFGSIEKIVSKDTLLASNTSSLSIASISSVLSSPERMVGIHFFNPATIMPLVEIIPSLATNKEPLERAINFVNELKKTIVIAKDTPGFIVNRLARPFYGEALRIVEEQMASFSDVDYAMRALGFKMGPFELMDFIGHDVNYRVTETVWTQMFFDPRYRPSLIQKRLFESGFFGKKRGEGIINIQKMEKKKRRLKT